jgi:hypothetical protein
MNRARIAVILLGIAALAVAGLVARPASGHDARAKAGHQQRSAALVPATTATTCRKTFSSGSGASRFAWCYSNDGNIIHLESPAGQEHIFQGDIIEGYAICSSTHGVEGYDAAEFASGFKPPTYPATNTVQVDTTNNNWRLKMVFSQDTGSKIARVQMTLTNRTAFTITGVRLSRFVDFDIDNTAPNDRWDKTNSSVVAIESNGVTATAVTPVSRQIVIEAESDLVNDNGCDATTPLTPPTSGDDAARLTYSFGSVAGHQSKTVVVRYQRM